MGSVAAHSPVVRARSTSGWHALWVGAFAFGGLVVVLLFVAVAERIAYSGEVMPGVEVAGVDVAGLREQDAYAEISELAGTLETEPLRAKIGDIEVAADASVLQVQVDELATLRPARRAGRSGNPIDQTLGTVFRRFRGDEVPLALDYSEAGLAGTLDGWVRQAAAGGIEGNLLFSGTQVVEVVPKQGTGILREEAEERLVEGLSDPNRAPIELPLGDVDPQISAAEVTRAAAQARELLTGTHRLTAEATSLTITPEQLVTTLGTRIDGDRLELTIDADKLRVALAPGLAAFERAPVDASFAVSATSAVSVVPSATGLQVDLAEVAAQILAGNRQVTAPMVEVPPARTTAQAEALGIKEQVSTFTTRHNSGEERVKNIHRGADILNNTIVEPGATFSLNDTIGPRTAERGFVVAPVFYGEFTEDVGGGVSQLATTVFNAVFFGGYEDVYHKPHTIYITRYPMGREATVNYPSVDLKFRNNTNAGVLIRTSYTSNSITVTFYGDKEGKVVTEDDRRQIGETPIEDQRFDCPGPSGLDKGNICPRLAAGEARLAEGGHTGIDVEYFRVIERPGREPERERFTWRYRMFPNKYLVGVGPPPTTAPPTTAPPPSAPAPTTPPPTAPATTAPPVAPPPAAPPAP